MDGIINSLNQNNNITGDLEELGTLLRDSTNRCDPILLDNLPFLLSLYKKNSDQGDKLIRVLVNFTADNDLNRSEIIKYPEFWENLDYNDDKVKILINQFIRNTENSQDYLEFFMKLKIYRYMEDLEGLIEFLSELITPERLNDDLKSIVPELLDKLIGYFESLDGDDDDDKEDQEFTSLLMSNLTQYQDLPTHHIHKIYPLFNDTVTAKSSRYLFATIGNLSSMINFNDFAAVEYAVDNKSENMYLQASYYLVIGNYITSKSTQAEVLNIIDDDYITKFFHNKFTDVVQFQSIHLMKNLINQDNAMLISGQNNLQNFAKVIVDNKSYYGEIYQTFLKFIKKMVTYDIDIYDKQALWELIDDDEIWSKLSLKAHTNGNAELNLKIIQSSFKVPLESHKLLDNLKSMAVLLNHQFITQEKLPSFKSDFLPELEKLKEVLINSERNRQFDVLLNNSKFVMAGLIKLCDDDINRIATSILSISS